MSRRKPGARELQRGRSPWWLAGVLVFAVCGWWLAAEPPASAPPPSAPATGSPGAAVGSGGALPARSATSAALRPPYSPAGEQARQEQHALWQARLERAEDTLRAYRQATRYPTTSQPLGMHPDQAFPNQPIEEEHGLGSGSGKVAEGVKLRTSQERVFVQGEESVRFTAALQNAAGAVLPMRVIRASAREMPPPNTGSMFPVVPLDFNDEGRDGDATAGDGTYGVRLQPQVQGFAGLFGQIRVELVLQHGAEQGVTWFDVVYSPGAPAEWQGGVREALEDGSLHFHLRANVREAGRYVVSARVDDANGVPFALLGFNDEVHVGAQEFRLTLFGKLVRDARPAFPLTLRDVDAFLLRPDAYPDRRLMPRRAGKVHQSQDYVLTSFADAEWEAEERTRYLRELGRDVAQAQDQVRRLGTRP